MRERDEFITEDELAEITGISKKTLANHRASRMGFPFYKVPGIRKVFYKYSEVMEIIASNRVEVRPFH